MNHTRTLPISGCSRIRILLAGLSSLRLTCDACSSKYGAYMIQEGSRSSDMDTHGNPIPMNAQQRRVFDDDLAEYDRFENIAFSDLMKACKQYPKEKNISETRSST